MFKSFFWKEWRECFPVLLLPLAAVLGTSLYVALRFQVAPDVQRNTMCFLFWPGSAGFLAYLLLYQESEKKTLEFLFSTPLAKHAIWFAKVSYGLVHILLMCLISFVGYFIVTGLLSEVSLRSLLFDPCLLVGLCLTVSVFCIALSASSVSRRERSAFGIVMGVIVFVVLVPLAVWSTDPYFRRAMAELQEKPIVLSLLVLGVSPLFLFISFISFNRKELLSIRRRSAIACYFLSAFVILFILNSAIAYVKGIGRIPAVGDTIEMTSLSPDFRTILLLVEEKGQAGNVFTMAGRSIYTMDTDGKNLRKLVSGNCQQAFWSPRGDKIAFSKEHGWFKRSLYVMDKDGSNPVKIETFQSFTFFRFYGGAMWSPDGNSLVYISRFLKTPRMIGEMPSFAIRSHLTISRADGTEKTNISFPVLENASVHMPDWAEDGAIYFRKWVRMSRHQREVALWKIEPGQTRPQPLAEGISRAWASPQGWVAYTSVLRNETDDGDEEEQGGYLFFVNNARGERILEAADISRVAWSLDGRHLAYVALKGEAKEKKWDMDCIIFDTATGKKRTEHLGRHRRVPNMQWAPDGNRILFIFDEPRQRVGVHVLRAAKGAVVKILDLRVRGRSRKSLPQWAGADEIAYLEDNCLWLTRADGSDKRKIFSPR